jgi:hypothetical protein
MVTVITAHFAGEVQNLIKPPEMFKLFILGLEYFIGDCFLKSHELQHLYLFINSRCRLFFLTLVASHAVV